MKPIILLILLTSCSVNDLHEKSDEIVSEFYGDDYIMHIGDVYVYRFNDGGRVIYLTSKGGISVK